MTTIVASSGHPPVVTVHWEGAVSTESASLEILRNQNVSTPLEVTRSDVESSAGPRIEQSYLTRLTGLEQRRSIKQKTYRKARGILLGFFGEEAKVAFDVRGQPLEYWLPAKLLRKNGVTMEDQPFELIEGERQLGTSVEFYTHIVALADASSSTMEPLALEKSYEAKLKFILKSPGKKDA
ncbi:MAG TPA: hypothetical protein VGY91_01800 [Chthoniobacterales bacterium]|jgi:hypothetical protein|nr:hypothetical protein [Chthoniobacterales bacterium]